MVLEETYSITGLLWLEETGWKEDSDHRENKSKRCAVVPAESLWPKVSKWHVTWNREAARTSFEVKGIIL